MLKWALYEGKTQECCWIKLYFVGAKKYLPMACPDIFDRGGTSGALTYAGVAWSVSRSACADIYTHVCTPTPRCRHSINLPFLYPQPISTSLTNTASKNRPTSHNIQEKATYKCDWKLPYFILTSTVHTKRQCTFWWLWAKYELNKTVQNLTCATIKCQQNKVPTKFK